MTKMLANLGALPRRPTCAHARKGVRVFAAGADPELSTILVGDWLDLWPITHENKHTKAWQAFKQAEQQRQ
jgi:hypothetical protein